MMTSLLSPPPFLYVPRNEKHINGKKKKKGPNSVKKFPILYFLAGLTSNEDNFMIKAGAQRCASEWGLALVTPDTSPRGAKIEGEDKDWDFGVGAGFYVNATKQPWQQHYQMYDYVTKELPNLIATQMYSFTDDDIKQVKQEYLPLDTNNVGGTWIYF
ncbi:S-formylglutathione hydrolase [Reticulomyxa filosa]|uniref:S-formylglutathione hydrolase n=1 Tax=Reticulomyxa filosa TaxID=46433 RepID=X6P5F5_RETFI|nr:S-formylglutathione hydrolase [Reticulomyxa filosa]|eukprot:ETO33348.1 S-formylglutathione hydrolase [Reticulomyxa filosa]